MNYQVLLFYKYVTIEDPQEFADTLRVWAVEGGLKGRIIVAEEGLNGTVEGTVDATEDFAKKLLSDSRFSDMNIKRSEGDGSVFPKLSIKVRNEIVGTHFSLEDADPRVRTAPHLKPEQLREWYETNKDFVIIDMRNSYEYASGHFRGSIDPGMSASRDLPMVVKNLEKLKDKTVLTVCTGGVRCEKMSAYLLSNGFKDVYQLENGMHAYMEKYPGKDFLGTLYTFDGRVTMDFGGSREVIGECRLCGAKTERYVNCGNDECHLHFLVCDDCASSDKVVFCSTNCSFAK